MKAIYGDTSVLIAKYKPNDELFEVSKEILQLRKFKPIISHISLVELISVISRQFKFFKFRREVAERMQILNYKEKVFFIMNFIIQDNDLLVVQHSSFENLPFITESPIYTDYSRAIIINPDLKLRTLGNLHIASAKNISLLKHDNLHYFVTGDNEILSRKKEISEYLQTLVISPVDLIKIDG